MYADRDHIEVVVEVLALAQAEQNAGNAATAIQLFSRARITSSRLLSTSEIPDVNQQSKYVNALLVSLYSLRNLEKLLGNTSKAASFDKEAKELKKKYLLADKRSKKHRSSKTSEDNIRALLSCRQEIRCIATKIYQSKSYSLIETQQDILEVCASLERIRNEYQGHYPSEEGVICAVDSFISKLKAASEDVSKSTIQRSLFDASDNFRAQLRGMGFKVSDGVHKENMMQIP